MHSARAARLHQWLPVGPAACAAAERTGGAAAGHGRSRSLGCLHTPRADPHGGNRGAGTGNKAPQLALGHSVPHEAGLACSCAIHFKIAARGTLEMSDRRAYQAPKAPAASLGIAARHVGGSGSAGNSAQPASIVSPGAHPSQAATR